MSKAVTTYEKIAANLFAEREALQGNELIIHNLSDTEIQIKTRWEAGFTFWLDKPYIPDKKIIDFLIQKFQVSKSQAYNDLDAIKKLLGNVRNASKEWSRRTVIEMIKEGYEIAKKKRDPIAIAMLADKLGKYTRCHIEDIDDIDWSKIVPPEIEPTNDPGVLNLKHIAPEVKERLRRKYLRDDDVIKDAELVE